MNLEELRSKVLPVVQATRSITLPHFGNVKYEHKSESPADTVTQYDIEVEKFLRKNLIEMYPEVEFVGEETGGNRDAQRKWLCDPIDGTGNYIRGIEQSTTMLALIENDEVIASIIYDFVKDNIYYAVKGEGAYKNSEKISVSKRTLKESYIAYEIDIRKPEAEQKLKRMNQEMMVIKNINAGYDMITVASGAIDARIHFEPYGNDYDYAPGALLIQEAGGVVANIGVRTYDYKNTSFIAANPIVFKELTEGENPIFPITE